MPRDSASHLTASQVEPSHALCSFSVSLLFCFLTVPNKEEAVALRISYMGTINRKHAFVREPDLGLNQLYQGTKEHQFRQLQCTTFLESAAPPPIPHPTSQEYSAVCPLKLG